jgi:predicted phosphodiesterase
MRIAILSDVHGNLTALEAVRADLRDASPDLVLHGGDLADAGASPVEVVDRIRDLGWPGVRGNTDEMLAEPESLRAYARDRPALHALFAAVEEMAAFTRAALGPERLAWLRGLPARWADDALALVHASPDSAWRAPAPEATDAELATVYAPLARALVVYGHVHRPFVRALASFTVGNGGSVGQPHDGDPRASYLLVDDGRPQVRRVAYDVARERAALSRSGLPHAGWVARILESARPEMP